MKILLNNEELELIRLLLEQVSSILTEIAEESPKGVELIQSANYRAMPRYLRKLAEELHSDYPLAYRPIRDTAEAIKDVLRKADRKFEMKFQEGFEDE